MNIEASINIGLVIRGWSVSDYAERVGITTQSVRNIRKFNSTKRLEDMAAGFGVSVKRFIEWGEIVEKEREALKEVSNG